MGNRTRGLLWAVICCPVIAWISAFFFNELVHGRVTTTHGIALFGLLPATCASVGNALLGRSLRASLSAGVIAAATCGVSFVAFVVWFVLTTPPEFFQ